MIQLNALPEPQVVPLEYGGKWIAWSADRLRIIAQGDTLDQCEEAANKAGESDPCFEKVPAPHIRLIGGVSR